MTFQFGCVVILTLFLILPNTSATSILRKHFEWNILDFEYPDNNLKTYDVINGNMKPENALPVGIELWEDKMFISVPRWKEGIPATLNYVSLHSGIKNPPLIPYPSLEANQLGNCDSGLSTVYRIQADRCDRLWVLDTGTFGIEDTTQNLCPYAINIFDLRTNTRIHRYEFRKEDTNDRTFIANTLVDIGETCEDTHAYFSDELGYGLIVYSLKENKSWRFEHSYFLPDPLKGDFVNDNLNFQWYEEGIFGMSLSPLQRNGFRIVYFSPLASNREFAVSTQVLQNSSRTEDSYHDFYPLEERGPDSHTTSRVMTHDGVQFFNLIDQNAIGCWNYEKPYRQQNIAVVDKNDRELIFPADIKNYGVRALLHVGPYYTPGLITRRALLYVGPYLSQIDRNNYVWVISDRMPKFLMSTLDYTEPNFRVYFAPVNALIKGTVCETNYSDEYSLVPRGLRPASYDHDVAVYEHLDEHADTPKGTTYHIGQSGEDVSY